jgi:hypothetical protein
MRVFKILLIVAASFFLMAQSPFLTSRMQQFDGEYRLASTSFGASAIHRIGINSDVDASEETISEGHDMSGPARVILDTSAFTLYISSDNAGDTEPIVVEGLDANWDAQSVTVTLAGLTFTQVGTATNWMRVNRAYNSGTTSLVGTVYLHIDDVDAATADGIPDTTATDIRAVINAGENQTLQAVHTIPDNFVGFLKSWCVSVLSTGGGTGNILARLRLTPASGVGRVEEMLSPQNPGTECRTFSPPARYVARDALEATAISDGATNDDVASSFDLALIGY